MIEYIVAARAFATPHLFSSDGVLPATFTAMEDSTLLTASKESMFKLYQRGTQNITQLSLHHGQL